MRMLPDINKTFIDIGNEQKFEYKYPRYIGN